MPRQRREPRTLLEWNLLLATTSRHGDEREVTRWSAMKAMGGAMGKATRVAEFICLWTLAKYDLGEVTTEDVGARFGMNERTAYRRLKEFREVWGPPALIEGYETPDPIADELIADFRRRRQKLEASALMGLLSRRVELPPDAVLATA
jgi:hypothetical protein